MPLASTLFLPITYCAYSVIGVSVIRLITPGCFTFLFEVQHSRFISVIIIIETGLDRHENRKGWCRGIGRGDRTSRRNQMASQCQWYC